MTNKALIIAVEITAIALRSMRGMIEEAFERTNCRVKGFPVFSATVDMSFHPDVQTATRGMPSPEAAYHATGKR
jgi:hypothetical protein